MCSPCRFYMLVFRKKRKKRWPKCETCFPADEREEEHWHQVAEHPFATPFEISLRGKEAEDLLFCVDN